jgi:hypothetical protein
MEFKFLYKNDHYDMNYCRNVCYNFIKELIDDNEHITTIYPKTYFTPLGEITIISITYFFNEQYKLEIDSKVNFKSNLLDCMYMSQLKFII